MNKTLTTIRGVFASRHFLAAAGILLLAAVGWNVTMDVLGYVLAKKPVPLHRSLEETPTTFGRFVIAGNGEFPQNPDGKIRMTKDVEEILGTSNYILWIYRDNSRPAESPVYVRLHVAYYTDILDAAPHVPDICQLAGGAQAAGSREVIWSVPTLAGQWAQTPMRRSAFTSKAGTDVVFYVFNVNGLPINDRLAVRAHLSPPWRKYCYYAKIEISAFGPNLTPEENDAICEAFFAEAAPELLSMMASAEEIEQMEAAH